MSDKLDEEGRGLLRKIIERHVYRQMAAANLRGHGLAFLPDVEQKLAFVRDIEFTLQIQAELEAAYAKLDGVDLHSAVRQRMERIPYPTSRLDLAACLALIERAEFVAAQDYLECPFEDFALIARKLCAARDHVHRSEEDVFISFCVDPGQRPQAQQLFNRWLFVALTSLGRPGTTGDARAVALQLRRSSTSELASRFLRDVEPLRKSCGLAQPNYDDFGIDLPDDVRIRIKTEETPS